MTPATNISEQIYSSFVEAFGKKLVGKFFDGKKESNKLFVVANAQSLTKVTPGTEHYDNLAKTQVFIADESHQCPASTLAEVCFGVASFAPYRFFFSATQMRNDGKDLLLEGITGPIVYSKTVEQGVREGYLAKPIFRIAKIASDSPTQSPDANKMTRAHLYYNDRVIAEVGKIANSSANLGLPTLILIEEVEQFTRLLPYLRHEVGFAHGPLSENKEKVPKEYWESDPSALVKDFNAGKIPILVGTSCISTGTDIKPVRMLVYWQGGKSEIQVKQAIGRATRKAPNKPFCTVVDFDIYNIETLSRHAKARRAIYQELYPDVKDI
jgi:superfamily II DNA or RNA helicase